MLGQRTPQTSLFEGDQLYLAYVGAGTFYGQLARERHNLFQDEVWGADKSSGGLGLDVVLG
jgi:hypothetical protein